jgi:hypothetical protein
MKNSYSYILATLLLPALVSFSSCTKTLEIEKSEYEYYSDLSQTQWVITRYDNTLTNASETPMDTIHFLSDRTYRINQGTVGDYLYGINLTYAIEGYESTPILRLDNCVTFGGTYSAQIKQVSIKDGELNNQLFNTTDDNQIVAWLEQID